MTDETRAIAKITESLVDNANATSKILESLVENTKIAKEIHATVQDSEVASQREWIVHWLQSTDPTLNQFAAWGRHEPSTGTWVLTAAEIFLLEDDKRSNWPR